MFLRMRYRESVKCPHCGFDPILYKQNPKAAASKTKDFLESRKDNPEFLLKPQPKLEPIYLSRDQIQQLRDSGELPQLTPTEEVIAPALGAAEEEPPSGHLI